MFVCLNDGANLSIYFHSHKLFFNFNQKSQLFIKNQSFRAFLVIMNNN